MILKSLSHKRASPQPGNVDGTQEYLSDIPQMVTPTHLLTASQAFIIFAYSEACVAGAHSLGGSQILISNSVMATSTPRSANLLKINYFKINLTVVILIYSWIVSVHWKIFCKNRINSLSIFLFLKIQNVWPSEFLPLNSLQTFSLFSLYQAAFAPNNFSHVTFSVQSDAANRISLHWSKWLEKCMSQGSKH